MKISHSFDSGSIEVLECVDPKNVRLKIRNDSNSEFAQWFHFRVQGVVGQNCSFHFINAGESTYPDGWKNYRACASYDRINWFRVPTTFDGKVMTVSFTPEYNSVYLAYFPPYSYERHLDLLAKAQMSSLGKMFDLGETVDGRDINLLVFGEEGVEKKKIWVIARQHPGESMAEWFMEGFIERILDRDDAVCKKLLEKAVLYLVPNMNPDGSARGNLRANAAGANLNREWQTPSVERSPEVFYVRQKMLETGVNLSLDVHGDEGLPYNFIAACEGIPSYNEKMQKQEEKFIDNLISFNPDFQKEFGYERDEKGQANLTLATTYTGEQFGCLSLTLEMPFKDNANLPDENQGWSTERCRKLGKSVISAIYSIVDDL